MGLVRLCLPVWLVGFLFACLFCTLLFEKLWSKKAPIFGEGGNVPIGLNTVQFPPWETVEPAIQTRS